MISAIPALVLGIILAASSGCLEQPAEKRPAASQTSGTASGPSRNPCDGYASPRGSDATGDGSFSTPYRTAQRLVKSLSPGETGCLRAGLYTEPSSGRVVFVRSGLPGARIELRAYPGEERRATIRAQMKVPQGVDYITVRDLVLDGTGGPVVCCSSRGNAGTQASPFVHGDHTRWLRNIITKRNSSVQDPEFTGGCFLIGGLGQGIRADDTVILGNRIYGCGRTSLLPGGPDQHGIYASYSAGLVVRDNMIYGNGERGIQLYPNARGSLVEGNLIASNGQGVLLGGTSSHNTVRGNVIANPLSTEHTYNLYAGPEAAGHSNLVEKNCLWREDGSSGLRPAPEVFASRDNVTADPGLIDGAGGPRLSPDSRCRSVYSGTLAQEREGRA